MIVNAYSVLAAFLAALQLALGAAVAWAGVAALRRGVDAEREEERFYLPFLLSLVLVGIALVSWPLLYLLWQSLVPEWPDVMCIQGVTRIGASSVGAAAWLPRLAELLQWTKALLLFVTGAWLALHAANRRTRTGPLTRRVLAAMVVGGALAAFDALAEGAYLFIPKKEQVLATGCCSVASTMAPTVPAPLLGFVGPQGDGWTAPFFAAVALLAIGLAASFRSPKRARWLVPFAALSLPVAAAFLSEAAAPRILGLPFHRCPYCLFAQAPETIAGAALFALGAFGVGWTALAPSRGLVRLALFGYSGAGLLFGVEFLVG